MKKLSWCTDPFISYSASFIMKLIRLVIQHNLDIAVENFSLSTHTFPYLERYKFFAFLWSLKEEGGLPSRAWRAISQIWPKPWIVTFGIPWWWTWSCSSATVWMLKSFIFAFGRCTTPFRLTTDSQSHTLFFFWIYCDNDKVSFRTLANSFYIYFVYASMVTIFPPE